VLGRAARLTWLELRPLTGRTHQLRVHLAALGCPVLGDRIYGRSAAGAASGPHAPTRRPSRAADPAQPLLHLHARAIAVPLYEKRPPIVATAPPPAHMLDKLAACGLRPCSPQHRPAFSDGGHGSTRDRGPASEVAAPAFGRSDATGRDPTEDT
jgi:hypothetical protein